MDIDRKLPALPGADRLPKTELDPDLTRSVRETIPKARAHVERALEQHREAAADQAERGRSARRTDRLDLSSAAKAFAGEGAGRAEGQRAEHESDDDRAARVERLKELHDAGRLHDEARIELAAARLLGADPA